MSNALLTAKLNTDRSKVQEVFADANGRLLTGGASAPSALASDAIVPVATAAAAGSLVIKASAGNLYSVQVATGATAGYLLLFNATAAPADGAVTPVKAYSIAATSSLDVKFDPPLRFSTGITAVFSTTGPFIKTISATAFISAEAV